MKKDTLRASALSALDAYMRVGTTIYKKVSVPMINGREHVRKIVPWNIETLRQDFNKAEIALIEKYDGFCTIPCHDDFSRSIDGFYNLYEPISHIPQPGEFPHIVSLLSHVFDEQYEMGVDYVQILYRMPEQKLPILLLVSEDRNTGKSSFLNFLKSIFEENATFNTNEDFRSQFNSDWAGKLLVLVDEVLLNRREDSERLKNLSTTYNYKIEAKGKDRYEVPFFAKFVLCSNNERNPVLIDPGELRYWVRKIHPLVSDDPFFLEKVKKEIPAFLHFLLHRELSTQQESRMWFSASSIRTKALDRIIHFNRNKTEQETIEILFEIMENFNLNEVRFTLQDLLLWLQDAQVKTDKTAIRVMLKESWKLKPTPTPRTYQKYTIDASSKYRYCAVSTQGRFYTVNREYLQTL